MKNARIREKMVFCRSEQVYRPLAECELCGHFLRIEDVPETPLSRLGLPPMKNVICGLPGRVEVLNLMEEVKDGTDI